MDAPTAAPTPAPAADPCATPGACGTIRFLINGDGNGSVFAIVWRDQDTSFRCTYSGGWTSGTTCEYTGLPAAVQYALAADQDSISCLHLTYVCERDDSPDGADFEVAIQAGKTTTITGSLWLKTTWAAAWPSPSPTRRPIPATEAPSAEASATVVPTDVPTESPGATAAAATDGSSPASSQGVGPMSPTGSVDGGALMWVVLALGVGAVVSAGAVALSRRGANF